MAYLNEALATETNECRTRRNHIQAIRAHVLRPERLNWYMAEVFCWLWHPCHPDDIEELLEMTGGSKFPYEPSLNAREF